MPTAVLERSYVDLQNKVKHLLAQALKAHAIGIEELMAILFIFEKTETTFELEAFLEIFSEAFPVLQEFEREKKKSAKGDLEEKVKKVMAKLISRNPLKASEIAKATLRPGITWEDLRKEFPELEE